MPVSDYTPRLTDVGSILRTRTTDTTGTETGTFSDKTVPTAKVVEVLIDRGVQDLCDEIGPDIPELTQDSARYLAAVKTAMAIELSQFSEQVASNRSPYAQLRQEWIDGLARLKNVISASAEEEESSEAVIGPGSPAFSFPQNKGGMVGYRTRM